MGAYKLLTRQKNEIFGILQRKGLDPANFSWTERKSVLMNRVYVPCLNYRDSGFYFQFDFSQRHDCIGDFQSAHYCEFSPGMSAQIVRKNPGSWSGQLGYVVRWVDYLKREIRAPDLWGEMEKYKVAFSLAPREHLLNEAIPANEAEKIAEKLNSLADKIEQQFELTDEQSQFVRSKLNYLAQAAKRQRSMDWAHTLIGVTVTIAVGLSLAPDKAKELWELLRTLGEFVHLIGS